MRITTEDLGMTYNGIELPEVVAFDFVEHAYVQVEDDGFIPLDFDTIEALGWDGTLRDVQMPRHLRGHLVLDGSGWHQSTETLELLKMAERDALRDALFSSYAFEDLDQDEYDAINRRVYTVLGEARAERLAQICTGERWSGEDMMHCAFNPDDLLQLLTRLDREED
jgi:hypothetical protein